MSGILLIISGPAGSGKNTVSEKLIEVSSGMVTRAVTTTTRPPREGEVDGRDYYFVSPKNFKARIKNGDFYEWAVVHGRYYGTLKSEIAEKLKSGKDVILIIDVQGAKVWREVAALDDAIGKSLHSVFIRPQSLDVIAARMRARGDSEDEIQKRLETAKGEFEQEKYFDRTILSSTREADFAELKNIYDTIKSGH